MANVLILLLYISKHAFVIFPARQIKKFELNSGKIRLTQNSIRAKFRCRQPLRTSRGGCILVVKEITLKMAT